MSNDSQSSEKDPKGGTPVPVRTAARIHRRRRVATGMNVLAAAVLAGLLFLMVNYLAHRHYVRWDVSTRKYYELSEKTTAVIAALDVDVRVIAFFQTGHELFGELRALLKNFEYEARRAQPVRLRIDMVDPDRDLAQTRELVQQYELGAANTIVVESGGRRKYLSARDLADYDYELSGVRTVRKRRTAFRAEQVLASAIQSTAMAARPLVYFLLGHGERNIDDYSPQAGYSGIARIMRRDNIEVRPLLLADRKGVPEDCSALVIAGPDRALSADEAALLSRYLDRSGRLLVLQDPSTTSGLEGLLQAWGVRLDYDIVAGLTLTGRELVVTDYADHPVTRSLKARKVTTMFYLPRSVEPVKWESLGDARADKPRVTILATGGPDSWADINPKQNPPRFDPRVDRQGPIGIAAAVERGPLSAIEVELRSSRVIVIGDSFFVSNGALRTAVGGNVDFFMSALNWLVERNELVGIAAKVPHELRLDMDRSQLRNLFIVIVVGIPGAIALIGIGVMVCRR